MKIQIVSSYGEAALSKNNNFLVELAGHKILVCAAMSGAAAAGKGDSLISGVSNLAKEKEELTQDISPEGEVGSRSLNTQSSIEAILVLLPPAPLLSPAYKLTTQAYAPNEEHGWEKEATSAGVGAGAGWSPNPQNLPLPVYATLVVTDFIRTFASDNSFLPQSSAILSELRWAEGTALSNGRQQQQQQQLVLNPVEPGLPFRLFAKGGTGEPAGAEIGEVFATFYPAGNIPGVAYVWLEASNGESLVVAPHVCLANNRTSGPLLLPSSFGGGRGQQPTVKPKVVVIDSAYGNRLHANRQNEERRLVEAVAHVVEEQGGRVLLPALAAGRAQEIILALAQAMSRNEINPFPVWIDGPVAQACEIYSRHPYDLPLPLREQLLRRKETLNGKYSEGDSYEVNAFFGAGLAGRRGLSSFFLPVRTSQERRALAEDHITPGCIIAFDESLSAGTPSAYYASQIAGEANSAIFFSGYQDEEWPGATLSRLTEGAGLNFEKQNFLPSDFPPASRQAGSVPFRVNKQQKSDNSPLPPVGANAELSSQSTSSLHPQKRPIVCQIGRYSLATHADSGEIASLLTAFNPRAAVLVGGTAVARQALEELLKNTGGRQYKIYQLPAIEVEGAAAAPTQTAREEKETAGANNDSSSPGNTLVLSYIRKKSPVRPASQSLASSVVNQSHPQEKAEAEKEGATPASSVAGLVELAENPIAQGRPASLEAPPQISISETANLSLGGPEPGVFPQDQDQNHQQEESNDRRVAPLPAGDPAPAPAPQSAPAPAAVLPQSGQELYASRFELFDILESGLATKALSQLTPTGVRKKDGKKELKGKTSRPAGGANSSPLSRSVSLVEIAAAWLILTRQSLALVQQLTTDHYEALRQVLRQPQSSFVADRKRPQLYHLLRPEHPVGFTAPSFHPDVSSFEMSIPSLDGTNPDPKSPDSSKAAGGPDLTTFPLFEEGNNSGQLISAPGADVDTTHQMETENGSHLPELGQQLPAVPSPAPAPPPTPLDQNSALAVVDAIYPPQLAQLTGLYRRGALNGQQKLKLYFYFPDRAAASEAGRIAEIERRTQWQVELHKEVHQSALLELAASLLLGAGWQSRKTPAIYRESRQVKADLLAPQPRLWSQPPAGEIKPAAEETLGSSSEPLAAEALSALQTAFYEKSGFTLELFIEGLPVRLFFDPRKTLEEVPTGAKINPANSSAIPAGPLFPRLEQTPLTDADSRPALDNSSAGGSPGLEAGEEPNAQAVSVNAEAGLVLPALPHSRMEINAAYSYLANRLKEAGVKLHKASLKGGTGVSAPIWVNVVNGSRRSTNLASEYIELSFITPQLGERHIALLEWLQNRVGWPLAIKPEPNQELLKEAALLALEEGAGAWLPALVKKVAIHREKQRVEIKLYKNVRERGLDEERIAELFRDATGWNLLLLIDPSAVSNSAGALSAQALKGTASSKPVTELALAASSVKQPLEVHRAGTPGPTTGGSGRGGGEGEERPLFLPSVPPAVSRPGEGPGTRGTEYGNEAEKKARKFWHFYRRRLTELEAGRDSAYTQAKIWSGPGWLEEPNILAVRELIDLFGAELIEEKIKQALSLYEAAAAQVRGFEQITPSSSAGQAANANSVTPEDALELPYYIPTEHGTAVATRDGTPRTKGGVFFFLMRQVVEKDLERSWQELRIPSFPRNYPPPFDLLNHLNKVDNL